MEFITEIFDFFLPRFCPSCRIKLIPQDRFICSACLSRIKKANKDRLQLEFKRKFKDKKIILGFSSLYVFEKDKELQHIIHSLKYKGRFLIGTFLGEELGKKIKNEIQAWNVNMLLPVPLHQLKNAERGYNQSLYIAKGLSKLLKIPLGVRIFKRKRYTQSQTSMNFIERQENIKEAFNIKSDKKIKGKNILLVDDVITTGATISECGKVLLNGGANRIYAASIAIAD